LRRSVVKKSWSEEGGETRGGGTEKNAIDGEGGEKERRGGRCLRVDRGRGKERRWRFKGRPARNIKGQ